MTPAHPPIAITGIGLVTPAGIGREATWERVCSGIPTAARDPALTGLPVDLACRVPDFEPARHLPGVTVRHLDRYSQFALLAAREAVADAGLDPATWDGDRTAVVIGSAAGGVATLEHQHSRLLELGPALVSPLTMPMFLPNMAAGYLAIDLNAHGPVVHTSTACASGATAIAAAADLLRTGACDVVVSGGADAMITPLCAAAFHRLGALSRRTDDPASASRPFDADRDGFVLAEGAGVLVLEREADARRRAAAPYALLVGHGASSDAHHLVRPDRSGAGITRALLTALADADVRSEEVDHVNAHGTGTPLNDITEARVLARVLGQRGAVTSTKGVTGHLMGAAGAVEAALTALTLSHQLIPPTANLHRLQPGIAVDIVARHARSTRLRFAVSTSLGFGGHNAALVLRAA
ncbi:beta-ketoacyl-[acyl-carrier-protein] synthase family protein [Kitasatospora putterlickiae]|uniref:beta-ketoacyl-[acyl-carrier-protein] synthase family protein n=1 Tax=Kitasatospora putterlickiae TaxID=221725 RepID=UPI0031E3EF33